jgi:hypothetical protein
VFFQNSRHRLFSRIIKLFSFRKFGGIGPQSIDRAHGNGSMSPWDYIKSGSLIDGWVARIRTSEGVRTLLISSVDLKTNDPGGVGSVEQSRAVPPPGGPARGRVALRCVVYDEVSTYDIVATRSTHFAHL